MELPLFKYHPDPIRTGSVRLSKTTCVCCGKRTGYIYAGPVYAEDELDEQICPWCIASGDAHTKFDAEFCDAAGIGGRGWDVVPATVIEEVAFRTPCFTAWQQERWFTHCHDAAAFLGVVGYDELRSFGPEALAAIAATARVQEAKKDEYLQALSAHGQPTAYLFRCRHCGVFGGYSDFT